MDSINIIQFIFYLGIINIIFNFLWKWIFVLPASILFVILKLDDFGGRLIKIFGVYLMISLIALFTLTAIGESPGILYLILYSLIGAFVIFTGIAVGQHELRKEVYQNMDFDLMEIVKKDEVFNIYILIGSVVFYVFVLFFPIVSANFLISFLFIAIQWIYNIPIIGWLIGIGGALFLINTIFQGILIFGATITSIYGMFKKEKVVEVMKIEPNNQIDTYEFINNAGGKEKITLGYSDTDKCDIYWDDIVASKNNIDEIITADGTSLIMSGFDPEEALNVVNKECPSCGGGVDRFFFISSEKHEWEYTGWMEACFKCKKPIYFEIDVMD